MNRVLKIRQTEDQRVYVTTDTHLNHDPQWPVPIWESRGYASAKDHTDSIIDTINERVRPNDILFHLGDICLNTTSGQFHELIARIKCQNIYMLWGNHNNPSWKIYQNQVKESLNSFGSETIDCGGGWPSEFEDIEIYPFRYKNIVFVGNYLEAVLDGQYFVMQHYPIYVFNYMKDGAKMLCGHSHGGLDFSKPTNTNSKILDVSWDDFKKPLSLSEILEIMNKKNVLVTTDHHRNK
jgi:calcineurin-like phosphoesterase family protein